MFYRGSGGLGPPLAKERQARALLAEGLSLRLSDAETWWTVPSQSLTSRMHFHLPEMVGMTLQLHLRKKQYTCHKSAVANSTYKVKRRFSLCFLFCHVESRGYHTLSSPQDPLKYMPWVRAWQLFTSQRRVPPP